MMMNNLRLSTNRYGARWIPASALLLTALVLGACASKPEAPVAAIQAAERAIANAQREQTSDGMSAELSEARIKLSNAHTSVQQEKMIVARYQADEARVNAELATAKAEASKAQAVNDDMKAGIDALKQEMQRNSGAKQ